MTTVRAIGAAAAAITLLLLLGGVAAAQDAKPAQDTKLTVPEVTVTAPAAKPVEPPYLRDPWKAYQRNPMFGRYRNEESRFFEQPCNTTRISAAASGAKCLVGYRLTPGLQSGAMSPCDMGLDVVTYEAGGLAVEADVLSFDPSKITALGAVPKYCRVRPNKNYAQEEFQDMNQVTRRGSNFHNLVQVEDGDYSIEFFDSNRPCKAIRRLGPNWNGGKVWVMHVSVCRADGHALSEQDVAYATSALAVRVYDPVGNLVAAPK